MSRADKQEQLAAIDATVRVCTRCPLHQGRTHAVPGAGPVDAEIMFIGEAPGFHEDRQGLPFVGAAGQLLEKLLASIDLRREDVYITNVVKCRPPGNRDPEPGEIEACSMYLDQQLALIRPKVVVTLGRHSMARWFPDAKISAIHGRAKRVGDMVVVPMWHPAAALRNPTWSKELAEDFKKIPQYLKQVQRQDDPDDDPGGEQAQQLSLF